MNLKNKKYSKSTVKVQQKQRLLGITKLIQNFIENRAYLKCTSEGLLKENCKLFEGLRGIGKV